MKFRKVAEERWQSMNGRYEIWVQREGDKVSYGARVVATDDWLGITFTHDEAVRACRSYAAKHPVSYLDVTARG